MELSTFLPTQVALASGILLCVMSAVVLISNKKQREIVLSRLHFRQRRTSGAKTPPRSLSPENKSNDSTEYAASPPGLVDTFPPSRRDVLPELAKSASSVNKQILIGPDPPKEYLKQNSLPTTQSYNLETGSLKYTPTGFSTAEIKAMGDFPAYDILSGVPLPEPYKRFQFEKALPRPYRPLRWAYHQTMSLTKMETDWWLEVDNMYKQRIAERQALYAQYGKMVLDCLPGSELACKELMEMCLQFYISRYPDHFSLSADKKTFHNNILNTTSNLQSTAPLHVLLNNVPEDFGITLRNEQDGEYYFRAGIICSSLGWNVATKIGMNLKQIHSPIPDYKEKMSFSMDRFFSKMPTNAPIQRGSWGLEVGTPLFMPPGDPHEKYRESQHAEIKIEDCHFRVDWQTLRRLPLSAAVVFNFTGLFTPVTEFRDEPGVPALLVKIMREGKKNLMEYKNTWHVEHVVLPELERYAEEQVQNGSMKAGWEVETLKENPFFPGWEEKWHRQQGF